MKIHLWPISVRWKKRRLCSQVLGGDIDPDQWVELAATGVECSESLVDVDAIDQLAQQLGRVLATASQESMVPPSAGSMSAREWAELPAEVRSAFSHEQLGKLDPRLLSRSILSSEIIASRRSTGTDG